MPSPAAVSLSVSYEDDVVGAAEALLAVLRAPASATVEVAEQHQLREEPLPAPQADSS